MELQNFVYQGYQHFNGGVAERHGDLCKPGLWRVYMLLAEGVHEFFAGRCQLTGMVCGLNAVVDDFGTLVPVEVH